MYGGEGSNYSKERVIEESAIVLVFRNSHANFERNFKLGGLSNAHAQKDMTETFQQVLKYIKERKLNEAQGGRRAKYEIGNMVVKGSALILEDAKQRQEKGMAVAASSGPASSEPASSGQANEGGNCAGGERGPAEMTEDQEAYLWESFGPLTAEDLSIEGIL